MALDQYVGRTYDVSAFAGQVTKGEALLDQTLFGGDAAAGLVVTGVQKLAQRFLLEFLTVRGSIPFRPERGTRFIAEARKGLIRSDVDAYATFAFSLSDMESAMLSDEDEDTHPEERYAGAELIGITFAPGALSLHVRIKSRAGVSREVILPAETAL